MTSLPRLLSVLLFVMTAITPPAGAQAGDFVPCPVAGSAPYSLSSLGPWARFRIRPPGVEAWVTDGTPEGTRRPKELCGAGCPLGASAVRPFGDGFLLVSAEGLWFSDGTPEGTRFLAQRPPSASSRAGSEAFVLNDSVWVTDGTPAGTAEVFRADVVHVFGRISVLLGPSHETAGELVFSGSAQAEPGERWAVWRTRGVGPLQEISLGPPHAGPSQLADSLVATRHHHIFTQTLGPTGREFWSLALGAETAIFLGELVPGREGVILPHFSGGLEWAWVLEQDFSAEMRHLWRLDGTAGGNQRLASLAGRSEVLWTAGPADDFPHDLLLLQIPAPSAELGELWASRGGVGDLVDLGVRVRQPQEVVKLHAGALYFMGFDAEHGFELWQTDGTPAGTRRVVDLCPGPCSSEARPLTSDGERLFVTAATDGPGGVRALWLLETPGGGLRRLTPPGIEVGSEGAFLDPREGRPAGPPGLLFPAGPGGRRELWITDGSTAGTRQLVALHPEAPEPPAGPWLTAPGLRGYQVKVLFKESPFSSSCRRTQLELACLGEALCVSGAVPGRPEVFVRVVGPKPNGFLWPTIFRSTTSTVYVWVEQIVTGERRFYELTSAAPGRDELNGLFDRAGFQP